MIVWVNEGNLLLRSILPADLMWQRDSNSVKSLNRNTCLFKQFTFNYPPNTDDVCFHLDCYGFNNDDINLWDAEQSEITLNLSHSLHNCQTNIRQQNASRHTIEIIKGAETQREDDALSQLQEQESWDLTTGVYLFQCVFNIGGDKTTNKQI